jgi:hypothetical protein
MTKAKRIASEKSMLVDFFRTNSVARAQAFLANIGSVGTPQEILRISRFVRKPWNWGFLFRSSVRKGRIGLENLLRLLRFIMSIKRLARTFGKRTLAAEYVRKELAPGMFLFDSGESKSAILIFTGLASRPMIPTAIFLEAIRSPMLAKVFVHPKRGYLDGIQGVGATLEKSIFAIPELLKKEGLEVEWVIGTSAGGLAALMYSLVHHPEKTWLVGASNPKISAHHVNFFELVSQEGSKFKGERLTMFAGEKCIEDIVAGYEISSQLGVSPPKVVLGAGHSPMSQILQSMSE